MQVQSLDLEDPLEEDTATHSSILAWKIPWTKETGQTTVHKVPERPKHKNETEVT